MPTELAAGPFTVEQARAAGLERRHLENLAYRQVCRGVYVADDVPETPELRLAAVRLILVPQLVVSGVTATWLLGADCRRHPNDPIEVTVPPGTSVRHRGHLLLPREAPLATNDTVEIAGIAVTSPERTAFDMARRPDRAEGVVTLDALWRAGLVTPDDLVDYAARHPKWRGVRQIASVARLADRRSANPMESRLRMALVLDPRAGELEAPEPQLEVFDQHGHFVARLDLGYRKARVAAEYDGSIHERAGVRLDDMRRHNRLIALGWRMLVYGAGDVYLRRAMIQSQVFRELRRTA